jgi:endonuclease YncB( thermonuclease family)
MQPMGARCSRGGTVEDKLANATPEEVAPRTLAGRVARGKVLSVYDGDTCTCAIEDPPGSKVLASVRVRILGYDSPEIRPPRERPGREAEQAAGLSARDYLRARIGGKVVVLSFEGEDKYGRGLARVSADGEDVTRAMLEAGHGVPYAGGARGAFSPHTPQ